jgi:hypothetical protein
MEIDQPDLLYFMGTLPPLSLSQVRELGAAICIFSASCVQIVVTMFK